MRYCCNSIAALLVCVLGAYSHYSFAAAAAIAFDPKLGAQLPLATILHDERGHAGPLRQWTRRPAILAPVYFNCPNLCDLTLAGLAASLERDTSVAGDSDFDVLVLSIDPHEDSHSLQAAHRKLIAAHGSSVARWRLLRGDAQSLRSITSALGFRYFYDERSSQFAHAAGIVVLDARGRIVQYFPGVRFQSDQMRAALAGARVGQIGRLGRRLLLTCFDYDPATGRYSLRIVQLLRLLGIASAAWLAGGIFSAIRSERRQRQLADGPRS